MSYVDQINMRFFSEHGYFSSFPDVGVAGWETQQFIDQLSPDEAIGQALIKGHRSAKSDFKRCFDNSQIVVQEQGSGYQASPLGRFLHNMADCLGRTLCSPGVDDYFVPTGNAI